MSSSDLCFLVGGTILIFSRRSSGGFHLIRGVLGTALLILALLPWPEVVDYGRLWARISTLPREQALERVVQAIAHDEVAISAVLFVSALVMLAWMPRRRPEPADAGRLPTA